MSEKIKKYVYNEASETYSVSTLTIKDKIKAGEYSITIDASSGTIFCYKLDPPDKKILDLPELQNREIIKIIKNFWDKRNDYKEGNDFVHGGVSHKAGVLIYGPPGSGKTSTIKLLSKEIIANDGIVFYISKNIPIAKKFLEDFFSVEKNRSILVVFEDIDSIIREEGDHAMLQILDSNLAIDNVVFLATTNYPDRLEARFYDRPGRFSYVIKIDYPNTEARKAYLSAILKKHDDIDNIVSKTENFTIDHLTALINQVYREGQDIETVIQRLKNFWNKPPKNLDKPGSKIGIG